MNKEPATTRRKQPRQKSHGNGREQYVLRLFVSGTTKRSLRAIKNIKRICDGHLSGRYDLQVIDIYQNPRVASTEQIVAVPTLIKVLPLPLRQLIGDLADTDRTLIGLGLNPFESAGN